MNVIVTGASRGIGREIALKFAKSTTRVKKLFLLSRNISKLEEIKSEILMDNLPVDIVIIPFDFNSGIENYKPLNAQISCNHIDVLINNAGYLVNKPFNQLNTEDVAGMVQVNFTGVIGVLQELMGKFGGSTPTHIINIGSMGGYQGSPKFPGLSVYSATKAAIACLTECLATEHAGKNIFHNCLALGAVQTEMLNEAFPGYKAPVSPAEMAEYIVDFAFKGHTIFNGKVLPLSLIDPVR